MKRFRLFLAAVLLGGALVGCDTVSPGTPASGTSPATAPTGASESDEYPAPEEQSSDYPAPQSESLPSDSVYPSPQQ